jgi:hypothetical protein
MAVETLKIESIAKFGKQFNLAVAGKNGYLVGFSDFLEVCYFDGEFNEKKIYKRFNGQDLRCLVFGVYDQASFWIGDWQNHRIIKINENDFSSKSYGTYGNHADY